MSRTFATIGSAGVCPPHSCPYFSFILPPTYALDSCSPCVVHRSSCWFCACFLFLVPAGWVSGPVSCYSRCPIFLVDVCLFLPFFQLGVRCVSADGDAFAGTPGWRAAIEGVNGTVPTPSSETTLSTFFEVCRLVLSIVPSLPCQLVVAFPFLVSRMLLLV